MPNVVEQGSFFRILGIQLSYRENETNNFINYIWVAVNYRRKGIGTKLIQEAKNRFQSHTFSGKFRPQGMADNEVAKFYSCNRIEVDNDRIFKQKFASS